MHAGDKRVESLHLLVDVLFLRRGYLDLFEGIERICESKAVKVVDTFDVVILLPYQFLHVMDDVTIDRDGFVGSLVSET